VVSSSSSPHPAAASEKRTVVVQISFFIIDFLLVMKRCRSRERRFNSSSKPTQTLGVIFGSFYLPARRKRPMTPVHRHRARLENPTVERGRVASSSPQSVDDVPLRPPANSA
jgi:hypothetical protein